MKIMFFVISMFLSQTTSNINAGASVLPAVCYRAIEDSLVGTSGQSLINDLYQGQMTNSIQCRSCLNTSQRKEHFFDLGISVLSATTTATTTGDTINTANSSGGSHSCSSLEDSLTRMFNDTEVLDASNRYRCSACGKLTDATKQSRLIHIPPILTISLLRFNYDPLRKERYKETGNFDFPLLLDMSSYLHHANPDTEKEPSKASGADYRMKGCNSSGLEKCAEFLMKQHGTGEQCGVEDCTMNRHDCCSGAKFDCDNLGSGSGHVSKCCDCANLRMSVTGVNNGEKYHVADCGTEATGKYCSTNCCSSNGCSSNGCELSDKLHCDTLGLGSRYTVIKSGSSPFVKSLADNCNVGAVENGFDCTYLVTHETVSLTECDESAIMRDPATNGLGCGDTLGMNDTNPRSVSGTKYELFAVVVHRGNAHGGHYHVLIRDLDARGSWTKLESSTISTTDEKNQSASSQQPVVSTTDISTELDISSPRCLVTAILRDSGITAGMRIGDLTRKIASMTRRSWRKAYKPRHGSFTKFLMDNADVFAYNHTDSLVSLVEDFDHSQSGSKRLGISPDTGSLKTDEMSSVSHRMSGTDTVSCAKHSSKQTKCETVKLSPQESEIKPTDAPVSFFPSTGDQDAKQPHDWPSEFEHVSLSELNRSKNDQRQEGPLSCELELTDSNIVLTIQDPDQVVHPSGQSQVQSVPLSKSKTNMIDKASRVQSNHKSKLVPCLKQHRVTKQAEISSPRLVIACILRCAAGAGLSVTDLCARISEMTGDSWRKRYKPHHGSLVKFLADNSDLFVHDVTGGWVTLNPTMDDQVKLGNPLSATPTRNGATDSYGTLLDAVQHPHVSSAIGETATLSRRSRKKKSKTKQTLTIQKTQIISTVPEESRLIPGDCQSDLRPVAQTKQEMVSTLVEEPRPRTGGNQARVVSSPLPEEHTAPKPGDCWFDFNDSIICPIRTSDIWSHFSGKECAYMLFYRAVPLTTSNGSGSNTMQIPDWLRLEIAAENRKLVEQRAEYEEFVSAVNVEIHFGRSYECHESILQPRVGMCFYVEHVIDVRRDVDYLLNIVAEIGGELAENCRTVHIAQSLPFGGIHLYREVTASPADCTLKSCGIAQSTKLFVWNGREVDGTAILVGCENEPISLRFGLEASQLVYTATLARNTTLLALMALVARRLELPENLKTLQLYLSKASNNRELLSTATNLDKTVSEVGLRTRDRLIICLPAGFSSLPKTLPCSSSVAHYATDKHCLKQLVVMCENHISGVDPVTAQVEADSSASVQELKVLIMTCSDVPIELVSEVRLRVRLDDLGGVLGPPLHENIDLVGAGLSSGAAVVLERGRAPKNSEIVLSVGLNASTEVELTVDRDLAIQQLLHEVLLRATERGSSLSALEATGTDSWTQKPWSGSLLQAKRWNGLLPGAEGPGFHLCRTDWSGNASTPLCEQHQTVSDAALNHGDHLILRPGCPPPPGFLRIAIHPESSPARPCWWDPMRDMVACVSADPVGSLVVSRSVTLAELKCRIMAEVLADFNIPSPLFLRLRSLVNLGLHPGTVLRGHYRTLSQLKVGSAVGVEVLPVEEDLGVYEMVLVVRRRLPGQRQYADWSQEVVWNTGGSPTVESLHHIIAECVGEADSAIRLAKHIPDKYNWLVIPHSSKDTFHPCTVPGRATHKKKCRKGGKTGGAAGGSSFCDLTFAPFYLQDGDVIGVKVWDEPGGQDIDFSSVDDDVGRESLKSRSAALDVDKKSSSETTSATPTSSPETAIRIHVDNFR